MLIAPARVAPAQFRQVVEALELVADVPGPVEKRCEAAAGNGLLHVRKIVLNRIHELGRRKGAESIGRKVAKGALRSVHVP